MTLEKISLIFLVFPFNFSDVSVTFKRIKSFVMSLVNEVNRMHDPNKKHRTGTRNKPEKYAKTYSNSKVIKYPVSVFQSKGILQWQNNE